MFSSLPKDAVGVLNWQWSDIQPFYDDLQQRPISAQTVDQWASDWSAIHSLVDEIYNRYYVATSVNTADAEAQRRFNLYLDKVQPKFKTAEQALKEKLLASGLCPKGFDLQLKKMRVEAEIFRPENLPLQAQEQKLRQRYGAITGSQTVQWEGREITITQLKPVYQEQDRARREQAWRLSSERQMRDRAALNDLWKEYFDLRRRIAANAGFTDYRAYRWKHLLRFDYTPDDCEQFQRAIEEVAAPAAAALQKAKAEKLGLAALRPWDLSVDPDRRPPLKPFATMDELSAKTEAVFSSLDPALAGYFDTMSRERLLDLDNRTNKRPGGYCAAFAAARRPFIFANAVGVHGDVQTLLHESGHAFHSFESAALPYVQQTEPPMEFAEVASMGMELLAGPHLGAFYNEHEAARALIDHLEGIIAFWPYMAVVDAFQHWAYLHPTLAADPSACDAEWLRLSRRFETGVDWSGLDEERKTGWQRKLHIFIHPFYYV
ncbi:MAG: M3 family oligoendopeptidase, partial [Candidatus Edwardsbacteria bacterium]|nr:M3 family oligoendopeptidase [Candidatus Edwardsbacteria bacterium]